ncbi:MAG: hypothetical protein ACREEM_41190, partial [Blastocatellia bacterium]
MAVRYFHPKDSTAKPCPRGRGRTGKKFFFVLFALFALFASTFTISSQDYLHRWKILGDWGVATPGLKKYAARCTTSPG